MDGYTRAGHAKYSLKVHLIFVTKYRKQDLWSDGYFVCSIGQVSQTTVERYIQNQS